MWRTVRGHRLHHYLFSNCGWWQRRCVVDPQAFFELYGRSPEVNDEDGAQRVVSSLTATSSGALLLTNMSPKWLTALGKFSAYLYARPNEVVHRSAIVNVLEAAEATFSLPHDRRSRCHQKRLESALRVWDYAEQSDLRCAAVVMALLYYSGKYDSVIQQVEKQWQTLQLCSLCTDDTSHALRLMSIYTLSCSLGGKHIAKSMLGKVKELIENAMQTLQHRRLTEIARECKILFCALDWYFFHTEDSDERQLLFSMFSPFVPANLCPYLFTMRPVNFNNVTSNLPPTMLLRAGMQYLSDGDKISLQRLFTECKRRETSHNGFRLFQLTTRFGDMLSHIPALNAHLLLEVIEFCGTSLSYESLKKLGTVKHCRSAVLHVLGRMEGIEAYFAARQVLFYQNTVEALTFQEAHGDLFSGNPLLLWHTALQSMNDALAQGDMRWRDTLPTVLRLLSDAGKTAIFFQLLRETRDDGEDASLMTVSALGQATRFSGQWWRSFDILDMIISCDPPRTRTDDLFLEDACLQTMYALRDAKRWKEALVFYTSLAPVMPQAAHRVLCSVVCGMPLSSSWEVALATAQSFGKVPDKFLTTLLCAVDPDSVDVSCHMSSSRLLRYMLQGFAEGGQWQYALKCVEGSREVSFDAWVSLLRSAQRAPLGFLSSRFFECLLEEIIWENGALLRLLILIAEGHGYMKELHNALRKHGKSSLATEYNALLCFMLDGCLPEAEMTFTDHYVIHRLLMSPALSVKPVLIRIAWTRTTREMFYSVYKGDMMAFAQSQYKVHALCVPKKRCNMRHDVFTLQVIPPQVTMEGTKTIVAHLGDVIVAYKPPGVEVHSYSRSVLQQSRVGVMYSLAYLLSPSSSGLILLRVSTIPTKAVHLAMKVLLRVCPAESTSLPLMSTGFFMLYAMEVVAGPFSDGGILVIASCYSDPDGLLAGSLYRLKESVLAEGWALWKDESSRSSSGDGGESLHLAELVVSTHHTGFARDPVYFSAPQLPSWLVLSEVPEDE